MTRLLAVDDDPRVAAVLRRTFEREGYNVTVSFGGDDALRQMEAGDFDVVVLDVKMPPPDGFEVCRRLREAGNLVPVLLLTARSLVEDRVVGLDAGADDYLQKPFSIVELHARVRALLRRAGARPPNVLKSNGVTLDIDARRVWSGDTELELTSREFDVLLTFMRNPGRVLTRTEIVNSVWGVAYAGQSNVVDVYVRYLRAKLDQTGATSRIETLRGVGYRWAIEQGTEQAS